MKTDKQSLYLLHSPLPAPADLSRRRFIRQSAALVAASPLAGGVSPALAALTARSHLSASASHLAANTLGFNGERQDPATGLYPLGKGYRVYNPALMRFHASDSLSPFDQGGINSYAYSLGDPINLNDPSGHFALLSILAGAIAGAVLGAGLSAAVEGIHIHLWDSYRAFDWKAVAIGSALGLISGGVGASASGLRTSVHVGMMLTDVGGSGAADFGLGVAAGASNKQAGINAGIGAVIGLATFGLGAVVAKRVNKLTKYIEPFSDRRNSPRSIDTNTLNGRRSIGTNTLSDRRSISTNNLSDRKKYKY